MINNANEVTKMGKESLLLQPLKVGNLTLKNRIMFPPLTTGYEERDGSIGERSFHFYERLAKGGASYVVIGDVAPVNTASPTPKLAEDRQIPTFKKLADAMHAYDCKLALQIFHPEYDVPGVGKTQLISSLSKSLGGKFNRVQMTPDIMPSDIIGFSMVN